MSLQAIEPATAKPPQHDIKRRISRQVRTAIDAMVWQGLKRDEAAAIAGLRDNSLYVAMRKPDVKAYYIAELEVLRTSERARNIHTLCEVRDQKSNQMARVNAVQALERIEDQSLTGAGAKAMPGMVIIVGDGGNVSIGAKAAQSGEYASVINGERSPGKGDADR